MSGVETFAFALDEYFTSLRAADRAEKTITTYAWALDGLAKFVDATALDEVFSAKNIEAYLVQLQREGKASGSRAGAYRSFKAFGSWMERRGLLASSPIRQVPSPKNEPKTKVLMEDAQLQRLFDTCLGRSTVDFRDGAMLRVFATTGMRRGELARLRISDWDRTNHTLTIRQSKTRAGQRTVFVPAITEAALMAWLRERSRFLNRNGHDNPPDGPLFITLTRIPGEHMTGAAVHHVIHRRAALAGLDSMGPHALRHAFAHWSLASGLPELVVASALGHTSTALLASTYGASGRQGRSIAAYAALDGKRGASRR